MRGAMICLTTDPKPVHPAMKKGPLIKTEGKIPTLFVTWPNGEGVAGVDFVIGFDSGAPAEDYTQYDGWTMPAGDTRVRSEEHTSELQSLMRISYAVFCLKKKKATTHI